MGFLSDLFGGGKRPAVQTNVVSSKLPDEIAPYVSKILTEGQTQFDAEKAAGYQPYTGDTTARFTDQQEAALVGLEGLAGTQQPFLNEAGQIVRQSADQFTGDVAQQYMSPYQQAVTDIELREADRRFEGTTMPKLEAQAVNMGAMSGLGSRAGIEMAEAQRSQNQLLADIQAKGQQQSFVNAQQQFGLQKAREREMASDLSNLGKQEFMAGIGELGALKSAGEERQGLAQSALDEAYLKFKQEEQFPKENLAEFQQLVYGNPLIKQGTTTTTSPGAYQQSTGQQLLGLGMGAANIYGMGGGFGGNFSGKTLGNNYFGIPKKEGGGLSELIERKGAGDLSPASKTNFTADALKKQMNIINAMPEGQSKNIAKAEFERLDPEKRRQKSESRSSDLANTLTGSVGNLLTEGKKAITKVGTKRSTGITGEKGNIDKETTAGNKRISDLMKQLGPADVGGRGLIYKPTEQGVLGDLVASLGATNEGAFKTIRENKARKREDDLLKAGKLEEVAKESRLQKRSLRKEERVGGLEDEQKIQDITYDSVKAKDKIKIDAYAKEIGLEEKLDNYSVEIQQVVMKALKDGLSIEEMEAKIDKLKSEAEKNRADDTENASKLMKSAEYGQIMKSANLANNVTIDANGRVRQGGVPLNSQGALSVLVDIQTALKGWGKGADKYKSMQNSLIKNSVEKIINSMPMKYKDPKTKKIVTKQLSLKTVKGMLKENDPAKVAGFKSMLEQSGFTEQEIKSMIGSLK